MHCAPRIENILYQQLIRHFAPRQIETGAHAKFMDCTNPEQVRMRKERSEELRT